MTDTPEIDENDHGIRPPEGDAEIIDTDHVVGENNIQPEIGALKFDIHNPVFGISAVTIVAFVIITILMGDKGAEMFNGMRAWLTNHLAWFLLSAADIFLIVCLIVMLSPLGKIRLGGTEAKPDYGYVGWFSMLFAAGMGIGLMFYGVSEPLSHYSSSFGGIAVGENGVRTDWAPLGAAQGDVQASAKLGMAATIFHWGLHPWAIYAIVGLSLALFAYNKGLPLNVRSMFYPIFGERVWGWPGHIIDTLAVFATLFGLATSLGLGAGQANAGLHYLFDGIPESVNAQVVLIVIITCIALVSVVAGLDAGVKRLSELNMGLAFALLLFVIIVGPTVLIFKGFFEGLGSYIVKLPALSMPFGRDDVNFEQGWTSFYWAWWISWSPFVGMFIARVSRGRTVREFVFCVLIIPSLVSVIWMTTFGGTGIDQLVNQGNQALTEVGLPLQLFEMLHNLPWAALTSTIAIILVIVFFVTSSDSGSLVIDTITAGGKVNAPVSQRVWWALFEGLVAIVLLLSGGLGALQAMAVSTGIPFAVVLLLACYALIKGLRSEPRR